MSYKNKNLLKWLQRQTKTFESQSPDNGFAMQPYEQLAAILKVSGYQETATAVLIAKKNDQRRYGDLTVVGKAWNFWLGATIAHGYRPQRALIYSVLVMLMGWGAFTIGENLGLITEANGNPSRSYAVFDPLVYSIDTFTPVIDLHQEDTWLPDASKGKDIYLLFFKVSQGALLRYYFWLQIIAGWVLTSLWVAGFTGIVRNQ